MLNIYGDINARKMWYFSGSTYRTCLVGGVNLTLSKSFLVPTLTANHLVARVLC
jgi:hypothetical protein